MFAPHTIRQWNAAFADGSVDPVRAAEEAVRAAQSRPDVFLSLTEQRALSAARAATERLRADKRLGALDGIPMSWKDVFDQAGETTRAASYAVAQEQTIATDDAAAAALLESAGAVPVGRTNMTEAALSGLGLNPHFGTPPNVWSRGEALAPGGSSSGAAVSVASGIVAYALGSDTSGSVRIPAALNGLAGFKPTAERISRLGVWPLSPTLDSVGVLAHTADDVCTVMAAFGISPLPAPDTRPVLVIPTNCYGEDAEPDILAAFEGCLKRLQQAGWTIQHRPIATLSALPELFAQYGTLVGLEAYRLHHRLLERADIMDKRVATRLQANGSYPVSHLFHLLNQRSLLQHRLHQELQGALLAMPTTAISAPPLARLQQDDAYFVECNVKILRNTMSASFLNLPSFALPCGLDNNGLPASLMLSGITGSDETVLTHARAAAEILTGDKPLNAQRF